MRQTTEHGMGTSITYTMPWQLYVKARVLCSDGKLRTTNHMASTADTFFSVPASVPVYDPKTQTSKRVSGYVTFDNMDSESVCMFVAYRHGKNRDMLPNLLPSQYGKHL